MSTNLSQQKREKLLNNIKTMKDKLSESPELIQSLADIESELKKKKYGLVWEEHKERVDEEIKTKIPVFVEEKELEIKSDGNKPINFLIEGDNLHSLYLLEKTHKGKIDVIYIDPPYNTGNKDFIYDDNFIVKDDTYKHSKWLSFIKKRLDLANNLLSNKGVLFISIDDNEFAQLKLLCDEIFGENNFVTTIHWKRSESQNNSAKQLAIVGEYILCYAKNKNNRIFNKVELRETALKEYRYIDEKNGKRFRRGTIVDNTRGKNLLTITSPNGITKTIKSIRNEEFFKQKQENGEIYWTETGTPYLKIYLENSEGQVSSNWFDNVGVNEDASEDLRNMEINFSFSKPYKLIKKLINLVSYKKSIVLDFFAGSGTTGQAVLDLNNEDEGNRSFILCTNNENNICSEVTYKRLNKVINGYSNKGKEYEGIKANLKYYKTDFIDRFNGKDEKYYIVNELSKYIKELIQLENGIDINNPTVQVLFTDEEIEEFSKNKELVKQCKILYIDTNALIDEKSNKIFEENNIKILYIPEYYFEDEIMEVEQW